MNLTKKSADALTCPNCGSPIAGHPENGCLLAAFMVVLRERGTHATDHVAQIHARCDVDRLWEEVGNLIDRLGDGSFDVAADLNSESVVSPGDACSSNTMRNFNQAD